MKERVVITRVSALTPIGNNLDEIKRNLYNGCSGINYISRFNTDDFAVKHAGEIELQELGTISYPEEMNIQGKMFYYTLTNLLSKLELPYAKDRIGCLIGTDPNIASLSNLEQLFGSNDELKVNDINATNPMSLLYYASKYFNIHGPSFCNLGTCSASTQAIGSAYKMIKNKDIDAAIVGGISSKIDPISVARLSRLDALEETQDNLKDNCRPFDKNRRGFTMSEGCVLFLLESETNARKRKAEILGVVSGYGAALDGYSITDPHIDSKGMVLSMQRALEDSGIEYNQVDYINAHGTGTIKNDLYETKAIKQVFKEKAYKMDISSTKSMHGHLMTAAGAMEVLVCLLAIKHKFVPPTIHLQDADENCDLFYNPKNKKDKNIEHAISNSFGLGGQNASLVISKLV
ncbi:beta-ketoacyl-[acyl-carrier-protein] synthase family protein [Paenibacillus polysaccharolyticus]|uniref:beta-ketoacyl-[acyl-carrier-protein] synthase family protein n=1 Tax=Paenibacillus polysaccharolyticus TaxID=582692 RepID=UPI00203B8E03|nr:beta-ketoacyl-[acyl-carrier-protein] synthase family protein [Paenibacillus polysaccharolyticus]MCM3135797.1 beta-ketoacyl-[acyl-carrier-protein] synthase family protein [Paenibacillus polysaccharolyticus]